MTAAVAARALGFVERLVGARQPLLDDSPGGARPCRCWRSPGSRAACMHLGASASALRMRSAAVSACAQRGVRHADHQLLAAVAADDVAMAAVADWMISVTARITVSPARWPWLSLICLNRSRSSTARQAERPSRQFAHALGHLQEAAAVVDAGQSVGTGQLVQPRIGVLQVAGAFVDLLLQPPRLPAQVQRAQVHQQDDQRRSAAAARRAGTPQVSYQRGSTCHREVGLDRPSRRMPRVLARRCRR